MTADLRSERGGRSSGPALHRALSGDFAFALVIAALGCFVLATTGSIYEPPGTTVGPRVFPYVVGTVMTLIGILLMAQVLRGRSAPPEESEDVDLDAPTSWVTFGMLVAALLVHANLIVPIGWPIAAALLFASVAFILGSRKIVLTIAISVLLALAVYLLFTKGLGVVLPPGPLLDGVTWLRG